MFRCATAALLVVLAFVPFVPAADKPAKEEEKTNKPIGTWTHTVNEFTVTFTIKPHGMMIVQIAKNFVLKISKIVVGIPLLHNIRTKKCDTVASRPENFLCHERSPNIRHSKWNETRKSADFSVDYR